jgi:ABC-type glycerol-3-phosphate transport system substrate-binding protein
VSHDEKLKAVTSAPVSRRSVLKGGAAAAAGLALVAPKASKVFAAPAVLQNEPIKLQYVTWFWYELGRQDAWRFMIQKFHSEQNDIRIEEAGWPFADFTNNIVTELQAGKLEGDLIQCTPDLVLRLLKADVLAPLNSALTANNITTLSPAHNYITVDGNLYGLDVVTVIFGLLYNKAIFDAAGAALPTNVDEWLAVGKQLTNRPNQFGMFSPHLLSEAGDFWFSLQEWAMPYDGIWAQGKTPLLTSDPVVNGLKLFKDFYDNCMPQGSDNATAIRQWGAGQIAQQPIVSAAVNAYKANAPDIYPNLRTMSLPWASKRTISRIHPITVNNTAKNQEAAIEWVTWLYKPENYRLLLQHQLDVIPSYDVGGLDEYLGLLPFLDGYKDVNPITPPEIMGDFIFNNDEFGQIVMTHFQEVLTSNRPVEEAMADAQKEAEDLATRLES